MNFHQSSLSAKIKVARNFCTAARYGRGYAYLHMQSQIYYAVICSTEFILSLQEHNTEPQLTVHIPAKYPSMPNCDAASHFHTAYKMACGSSYDNLQENNHIQHSNLNRLHGKWSRQETHQSKDS